MPLQLFAKGQRMTDQISLDELEARTKLDKSQTPQRDAKIQNGIGAIRAGIAELAAAGYQFACVPLHGTHKPPEPEQYPKMLYGERSGKPATLVVENEDEEAEARSTGWGDLNPKPVAAEQTIEQQTEA